MSKTQDERPRQDVAANGGGGRPFLFRDVAQALWNAGFRGLIPIDTHAKRPAIKGWSSLNKARQHAEGDPMSLASLLRQSQGKGWGCGLCSGNGILALDVDCDDEQAARVILAGLDRVLGATPAIRVGRPPRFTAYFRGGPTAANVTGHRLPIHAYPGARKGAFGQTVLTGYHPSAGRPYLWPRQHILDLRPADLPQVPDGHALMSLFEQMAALPSVKGVLRAPTLNITEVYDLLIGEEPRDEETRTEAVIRAACQLLREADVGSRDDTASNIAFALYRLAQDAGDHEWLALAQDRLRAVWLEVKPEAPRKVDDLFQRASAYGWKDER